MIISSGFKKNRSASIALLIMLFGTFSSFGQKSNIASQEIKTVNSSATETFNDAFKAYSTENILEAKFYAQNTLAAARETKVAVMNVDRSLTESLKSMESENATLIDNIKDRKEEVAKTLDYAIKAYDYAEKACGSVDLEELHKNIKQVMNVSDKVIKQVATIQHYSDIIQTSTK